MMEPPPAWRIAASAHFVPKNTPLTLTAMMRSQSSSVVASIFARNRMPALLTSTFSLPYRSTAGLVGSPGETAAYTATKGAVRLFTKATAVQHAKENIRCNSVHPGPIATDMIKDMLENRAAWEQRLRRLPMGRVGTADDVGYGVLYLASDESSYVTGSELVIDGGTTAE